jgi:hypothetical protein
MAFEGQYRFWFREEERSREQVDLGNFLCARIMLDELVSADRNVTEHFSGAGQQSTQEVRSHFLSAIANALFLRQFLKYATNGVSDAAAHQTEPNLILDFQYDKNRKPIDRRMHVLDSDVDEVFGPTTNPTQWYRNNSLFVQRSRPANPTEQLLVSMEDRHLSANFQNMATLSPHLVSKHRM